MLEVEKRFRWIMKNSMFSVALLSAYSGVSTHSIYRYYRDGLPKLKGSGKRRASVLFNMQAVNDAYEVICDKRT